jgi:hypothetical protein
VQPALRTPGRTVRPDYVLYRDTAAQAANRNRLLDETALGQALAVADAKYWDRPLDQAITGGGDPFSNRNPGYQISFYIQHTGLPWGILTNGRLWRLYHRDTAHKLDRFYEVDLVELLDAEDPSGFQFFAGFFGRGAFAPGPLSLDALLAASNDYARGVSQGLKAQVYGAAAGRDGGDLIRLIRYLRREIQRPRVGSVVERRLALPEAAPRPAG